MINNGRYGVWPSLTKKLEAEISETFIKFQRDLIGRGPQEAKTYIVGDMVLVRFKGVLTVEENISPATIKAVAL